MTNTKIRSKRRDEMFLSARDEIAESLERRGLWLRAATRWGQLIYDCPNAELCEFYVQRREYCISTSNHRQRERYTEANVNVDFAFVRSRINEVYQRSNLGPVSYWYIEST